MRKILTLMFMLFLATITTACVFTPSYDIQEDLDSTWNNLLFKNQWILFDLKEGKDYFSGDIDTFYDYDECFSNPSSYWWESVCEDIKANRDNLILWKIAHYSWFTLVLVDLDEINNKDLLDEWLAELTSDLKYKTLKRKLLIPEVFINWTMMEDGSNLGLEFPNADKSKILFTFEWQENYDPVISIFMKKSNYLIGIYNYSYLYKTPGDWLPEYKNIRGWWNAGIFDTDYYLDVFNNDKNFWNLVENTIDLAYEIFELN